MWSSSHLHAPRRSHDQSRNEIHSSRSSSPDDSAEARRRTSSDATPRPPPATTRFLNTSNEQDTNRNVLSTNGAERSEGFGSSKRLGFFADKLTSSLSGTGKDSNTGSKSSLHPSQLLHPHSHSRADSTPGNTPTLSPTAIASSNTMSSVGKSHTSPSKASYGRTYDPKLVQREMHRLGGLVPSALAPQMSSAPSASSLSLPSQGNVSQVNVSLNSATDPWGALHVHVLPLFNGEPLRIPIEDLNVLVKRHVQTVVSSTPSKALATLENDASELIAQGMVTLNAKLKGVEDEKLVARVVEIWGFFWDQVLTYLEGVLLPLQTDPLLSSLYRTPKPQRPTSPNRQNPKSSTSAMNSSSSTSHIDVRSVALKSFRDRVILPPFQRLYSRLSSLSRQEDFQDANSYQQPRLQQMLLVLSAQSRYLPARFSLTTPSPQPTAGEAAVRDLLYLVRSPRAPTDPKNPKSKQAATRTPTFMTGGLPRDRRGRVALKGKTMPEFGGSRMEDDAFGDDATPRLGPASYVVEMEREREREFLEALRSPDIEAAGTRNNGGGWGLGAGNEEASKTADEEEESDWEHTQQTIPPHEPRRRMT